MLPYERGRLYFWLDWLAAQGFTVYYNKSSKVGIISHASERRCLAFKADSAYVLVYTSPSASVFDKWMEAISGGRLLPPDLTPQVVEAGPVDEEGFPLFPVRVLAIALGSQRVDWSRVSDPETGKTMMQVVITLHYPPSGLFRNMRDVVPFEEPVWLQEQMREAGLGVASP
jgi:hypothetical protein